MSARKLTEYLDKGEEKIRNADTIRGLASRQMNAAAASDTVNETTKMENPKIIIALNSDFQQRL